MKEGQKMDNHYGQTVFAQIQGVVGVHRFHHAELFFVEEIMLVSVLIPTMDIVIFLVETLGKIIMMVVVIIILIVRNLTGVQENTLTVKLVVMLIILCLGGQTLVIYLKIGKYIIVF